jgi:hypothetical protein
MKGMRVCVMAASFCKIKQRALIMFYFEASVNVLFLDAGIVSMLIADFLDMFLQLFKFRDHQTLKMKDKCMTFAKFKIPGASPAMLRPWSRTSLPNLLNPWAAFWSFWIGGTALML